VNSSSKTRLNFTNESLPIFSEVRICKPLKFISLIRQDTKAPSLPILAFICLSISHLPGILRSLFSIFLLFYNVFIPLNLLYSNKFHKITPGFLEPDNPYGLFPSFGYFRYSLT